MPAVKTHLSLNVTDVDRSTAWYEAFFGVPAHKRRPGYANFDLEAPGLKLALNRHDAGKGGALNHLGILVPSTDDVNAAKARLENAGLVTFSEENVSCCYALQDKIWVRDPDGNAWEVYTLLDEREDEDHNEPAHQGEAVIAGCTPGAMPSGTECCAPGCCA